MGDEHLDKVLENPESTRYNQEVKNKRYNCHDRITKEPTKKNIPSSQTIIRAFFVYSKKVKSKMQSS